MELVKEQTSEELVTALRRRVAELEAQVSDLEAGRYEAFKRIGAINGRLSQQAIAVNTLLAEVFPQGCNRVKVD